MQAENGSDSKSRIDAAFTALILGGACVDDEAVSRALDTLLAKRPNLTILIGDTLSGIGPAAFRWAVGNKRPVISDPRGPDVLVHYLPSGAVAFPGADTSEADRAEIRVWWPAGRG